MTLVPILVISAFDVRASFHPGKIFALIVSIWILIAIVWTWQIVGVWRSAVNHSAQRARDNKSGFWGGAAQFMVILGVVGNVGTFIREGIPQIKESYQMAFNDDPSIPDYSIRVMRDGTEAEIVGGIKYGLADDFIKVLNASRQIKVVHLDSVGGRVGEGERLFELIRSRGLNTYVATKCYSACTLAFAGGRERYIAPKGQLGFHRGSFAGEEEKDDTIQRGIFRRAGFDDAFIRSALSTPNKEMYRPSIDVLRNARVITGVAGADRFAYSGLGGHVDREEIGAIFARASPTFQTLKTKFPAKYESLVDTYVESVTRGKSETETLAQVRAIFLPFIQALMPQSDDDVLIRYNRLLIDQLAALQSQDASLCYSYAADSAQSGNIVSYFPQHLRKQEQELQELVLRTAVQRAHISEAEANKLYGMVGERLAAKGTSVEIVFQSDIPRAKHSAYCSATIDFYREISALPRKAQASLLRHTWAKQ